MNWQWAITAFLLCGFIPFVWMFYDDILGWCWDFFFKRPLLAIGAIFIGMGSVAAIAFGWQS